MEQKPNLPPRLLRAGPLETGFLFGFGFFLAGTLIAALAVLFLTQVLHSAIQTP